MRNRHADATRQDGQAQAIHLSERACCVEVSLLPALVMAGYSAVQEPVEELESPSAKRPVNPKHDQLADEARVPLRRSGSPHGGKGCEKPARTELTRFEGAKVRAKQRLRGQKRLRQNGGGMDHSLRVRRSGSPHGGKECEKPARKELTRFEGAKGTCCVVRLQQAPMLGLTQSQLPESSPWLSESAPASQGLARQARRASEEPMNPRRAAEMSLDLYPSPPQAAAAALPAWAAEAMAGHEARLLGAIRAGPQALMQAGGPIVLSHSVDFGVKRAAAFAQEAAPPFLPSFRGPLLPSGDTSSAPAYFRSLSVHNCGDVPALLLDLRLLPSLGATTSIHDGHGLARPSERGARRAVLLPPRSEYQLTVELLCMPQEAAFLQQWLLLTFALCPTVASDSSPRDSEAFCIVGRRVTALIARNAVEVDSLLSKEAKPFFPASLKYLFDKPPLQFSVARRPEMLPWMASYYQQVVLPASWKPLHAPLHVNRGPSNVTPLLAPHQSSRQKCGCLDRQLDELSNQLKLEEAAIQHDIRAYDMFNVHLLQRMPLASDKLVPGLLENRPAVLRGDVVYVRLARLPFIECAATVQALDLRETPQLYLRLTEAFTSSVHSLEHALVHVRFSFDRLALERMHVAISAARSCQVTLLPCHCEVEEAQSKSSAQTQDLTEDKPADGGDSARRLLEAREPLQLINEVLNEEQIGAVKMLLDASHGSSPYTIIGPPGTGKTITILRHDSTARICACAPSNYAADILCSGVATQGGISPDLMWRLIDPRRLAASVKDDALIPETLIPLTLAKSGTRILLCGDPCQLGPVVHSEEARKTGFGLSLLEKIVLSMKIAPEKTEAKLIKNYRANSQLLELPSRMFYNNELIACAKASAVEPPLGWAELRGRSFPMLFVGVRGTQVQDGDSPSYFNSVEAARLVDLVGGLLASGNATIPDIGVMTPYRKQVRRIRLLLRERQLAGVRVGTVDDYQGQEERIIFISTVSTRPLDDGEDSQAGILGNAKRFNVAITRAKALLVVLGHPVALYQDANWRELLRYCTTWGAYEGPGRHHLHLFASADTPGKCKTDNAGCRSESPNGAHMKASWGASTLCAGEADEDCDEEIGSALERLAELSLLGMGHRHSIFSEESEGSASRVTL
eukprot:SM000032S12055  [mRNA]  locus=s32:176582:184145:- [translate_table: standard]